MKSKAVLVTATALSASLLGGSALARNANTTQQGTLLVFPKVDVRDGVSTVIRISNNGARGETALKCFWQNGEKFKADFEIELTKNQPIWIDAASGDGTDNVAPFPTDHGPYWKGDPYQGELKCWVVSNDGITPIQYNHLSGSASVYNASEGTAYAYNAWRFRADATNDNWVYGLPFKPVTDAQADGSWKLPLDGSTLSSCPQYLLGQFQPEGSAEGRYGPTDLTVASCKQDFRQDGAFTYTKLAFTVWNEQETKFTGAYECMDSWWSDELEGVDTNGSHFSLDTLKTPTARYRVKGMASSVCNKTDRSGDPKVTTVDAGLVGVQTSELYFPDTGSTDESSLYASEAEELTTAGTSTAGDYIWYDQENSTPSKAR